MNQEEFIMARNTLINESLVGASVYEDALLNRTMNFVSANLLNFMPSISADQHDFFFRNLMLNKNLSVLEQQYPEILDTISYEGLNRTFFSLLDNGPAIFCTFHMGSNRIINHFLAANKIPFSLVVANHISRAEGNFFVQMYNDIYSENSDNKLQIIQAQESNVLLKMLRELKKGKSLLLYIDGNTGAGDDSVKNENRCKVDFLNQTIYARAGLCHLSHMARVPVVPVFCYRKTIDDIRLKFFPAMYPDINIDRKIFAQIATQKIYNLLVPILKKYPEQWETWIYLHTVTNAKELRDNKKVEPVLFRLNKSKYGFYNINSELFLFDKLTYNSYAIEKRVYDVLRKSAIGTIEKNEIDEVLFNQLYDNAVFVNS